VTLKDPSAPIHSTVAAQVQTVVVVVVVVEGRVEGCHDERYGYLIRKEEERK